MKPPHQFRVAVIQHRGEPSYRVFSDFHEAREWGWVQLKRQVDWCARASFTIIDLAEPDHIIIQIVASERVGVFDRGSETYELPTNWRQQP